MIDHEKWDLISSLSQRWTEEAFEFVVLHRSERSLQELQCHSRLLRTNPEFALELFHTACDVNRVNMAKHLYYTNQIVIEYMFYAHISDSFRQRLRIYETCEWYELVSWLMSINSNIRSMVTITNHDVSNFETYEDVDLNEEAHPTRDLVHAPVIPRNADFDGDEMFIFNDDEDEMMRLLGYNNFLIQKAEVIYEEQDCGDVENTGCVICYERSNCKTTCGHQYCEECLKQITNQWRNKCCYCRQLFSKIIVFKK